MADSVEVEARLDREEGVSKTGPPRPYFRERSGGKWLLIGLAAVVATVIAGVWRYTSLRESTDDAQIDGHIIPISARVGGTIAAVNVNDNQYVEAGTVLASIDAADFQVALERARADFATEVAAARAARTGVPIKSTMVGSQLSAAEAGIQSAQAGVSAAQQDVDAAQARLNSAQAQAREVQANEIKTARDLDRMKHLIAEDVVSQQQYDAAVAAAEAFRAALDAARSAAVEAQKGVAVAESRLTQARARLAQAGAEARAAETAPEQVSVSRAQAASAEAKVEQMKAALDQAQLNLSYTSVKAPISGWVSKKSLELGQVVQAGQPLLAIVPLEDIWVTANFKETQLKNLRPGQRAILSVDALGGRKFKGHVDSIAAATGEKFSLLPPENAAGNYVKVVQRVPVKILFEKGQDPEHRLRPGMSAEPTVITR